MNILDLVKPENINRYLVRLQNSEDEINNGLVIIGGYVLSINNKYGGQVCRYLSPHEYDSKMLDDLNLLESRGEYPYYILLPEIQGAGRCWLEWVQVGSRDKLNNMIQEDTLSEDFDGLRRWVEQSLKDEKKYF